MANRNGESYLWVYVYDDAGSLLYEDGFPPGVSSKGLKGKAARKTFSFVALDSKLTLMSHGNS